MTTLDDVVKNVRSKSRKIRYNPAKKTNWCNLPMEMRLECLKHMEFKTRASLRATSTVENALVDSKKIHFNAVRVNFSGSSSDKLKVSLESQIGSFSVNTRESHEKTLSLLDYILKMSESIDYFKIHSKRDRASDMDEVLEIFRKNRPLQVGTFRLQHDFPSILLEFLQNCRKVDDVVFATTIRALGPRIFEMDNFLRIPAVSASKHICLFYWISQKQLHQLVWKWIEEGAEVGTSVRLTTMRDFSAARFEQSFGNRLVKTPIENGIVRIRTIDDSKHVLLTFGGFLFSRIIGIVIPADLPESDEEEWLQKPKNLICSQ